MAKKKKNLILLLSLCAVLAGSVILYLSMPQKKGEEEVDSGETEEITVDKIDSAAIVSLVVEKEGKEIYSVEKKGDTWQFADEKEIPLDSDTVSGLFACLNPVTASRKLQPQENQELSQYGLDAPAMSIRVSVSDGTSYQYKLGAAVPITGGYYGMTASDSTIYCLEEALYTTFDIEKNSLIQMEELPKIEASYMTDIRVENKKGNDFRAALGDDGKTWEITEPDKKSLTEDDTQWDTVKGYFTSLTYDSLAEYRSSQLSKYGLEDPSSVITVKYYEEEEGASGEAASGGSVSGIPEENRVYKTLQLCIGDSCEEGYYVCEKGSSHVYIMSAETVEHMTGVDEYGLG